MSAGHSPSVQWVGQVNHLILFRTNIVMFYPRNVDTEIAQQDVSLIDYAIINIKK